MFLTTEKFKMHIAHSEVSDYYLQLNHVVSRCTNITKSTSTLTQQNVDTGSVATTAANWSPAGFKGSTRQTACVRAALFGSLRLEWVLIQVSQSVVTTSVCSDDLSQEWPDDCRDRVNWQLQAANEIPVNIFKRDEWFIKIKIVKR